MVLAMLDEAMPEGPAGIYYVVAAAVVIDDQVTAREAASKLIDGPNRTRGFHWHTEGITVRDGISECLSTMGAVAACVRALPDRAPKAGIRSRQRTRGGRAAAGSRWRG